MKEIDLVGKIGSMALIDRKHNDIDYNKFARISRQLKPGMIWVTSGATEIGRLDYLRRSGRELCGEPEEIKTDYAAQGQAVLMQTYRTFVNDKYSLRQVLVEHHHFNDESKRRHIKEMLLRCADQNAIPIINYNDAVSAEENRKMEIKKLKEKNGKALELVDNDETASQIACLVRAKTLLILSTLDGIYRDVNDASSLIREIGGDTAQQVVENIDKVKQCCKGSSRAGANGAYAKLEYIKPCVLAGTEVIIACADYDIDQILAGNVPRTVIRVTQSAN